MAVLSMSKQEFSRLDVLLRVQSGRLRVTDACALIGLQRRQVFRLLRGLLAVGEARFLESTHKRGLVAFRLGARCAIGRFRASVK